MDKLKDIFYDKNDILVAIIILVIAAAVILWRVDAIMAYPAALVSGKTTSETPENPDSPDGTTTASGIGSEGGESSDGGDPENEVKICAIYVNYGESLDVVAQNCVSAGLIGSTEDFINAVNAAGAAGSIQAGQHHIPSNVTPAELVQYLTKPGL